MTAQEILRLTPRDDGGRTTPVVEARMPLSEVLSAILDSPTGTVSVSDGQSIIGTITATMALQAAAAMLPPRPESSQVTVTCSPSEYSASSLARAVEDADAHLLDLYTLPAPHGNLKVVIRTSRIDPSPVVHSLRRYGFSVTDTEGFVDTDHTRAAERIEELRRYFDL